MRTGMRLSLFLLLLFLAGCGVKTTKWMMEKITPPEDDALARELIAALIREDYEFIMAHMDKRVLGETPQATLKQHYPYIDHDTPKAVELVGCSVFSSGKRRRSCLTYQLEFPHSWCTAALVVDTEAGTRKAVGFHVKTLPASLAEINRFTFEGKTLRHYVVLLNAVGVPVLIFFALIQCIRTRINRKWLWIPFILIGLGAVQLNWTTGQINLQVLAFHVPGAALARGGPYAPWMLSVSCPLGAVLFLRKRRKLRAAVTLDAVETPGASEDQSTISDAALAAGPEDVEYRAEQE